MPFFQYSHFSVCFCLNLFSLIFLLSFPTINSFFDIVSKLRRLCTTHFHTFPRRLASSINNPHPPRIASSFHRLRIMIIFLHHQYSHQRQRMPQSSMIVSRSHRIAVIFRRLFTSERLLLQIPSHLQRWESAPDGNRITAMKHIFLKISRERTARDGFQS